MCHAIGTGNNNGRSWIVTNSAYLISSKFGIAYAFSTGLGALAFFISMVVNRRVPSEIRKMIVDGIPVMMTGLMTVWRFTDKSAQYKAVDE